MAGSLFPQYGRIVYLDADVLLAGDVAELYFSDLRGASVAAAGDGLALWSIEKGTMHPHLEYMGNYLSSPLSYCNSGVLVLDLDQMRRRNLEHRLLQWLRSRPEPFPYPDQDILNIALHGDITPLPPEWNFQFLSWTWDEEKTRLLRGTEFENVPSISCGRSWKLLHMVGPEKHGGFLTPPEPWGSSTGSCTPFSGGRKQRNFPRSGRNWMRFPKGWPRYSGAISAATNGNCSSPGAIYSGNAGTRSGC